MNTIDDRLEAAASEVRRQVALVPARRPRSVARTVRRTRAGELAVAVVAVLALVVAGSLVLGGGGSQPAASTAGIPPLFVDVTAIDNDLTLSFVDDQIVSAELPDNLTRLRSYGEPSAGLADPRLWVLTYPEGSDFFRGAAFDDPGWEPVDVPSGRGYITTDPSTTVMWSPSGDPDAPVVRIQGYGVGAEDVLAALDSMEDTGGGWAPATLPVGFVERYDGFDYLAPGERMVAFIWAGTAGDTGGGEVTLWLYRGLDDTIVERNLLGVLPYGPGSDVTASRVDVRGHDGVEYVLPEGVVYQWMETPEVFARLLVQGPVDPGQALGALVEIDPGAWRDTIETWEPQPADADATVTTVSPTTTGPG